MSINTTLHATAPLLYPCRRYPKGPWGLYASPPPVAMAVVGWFLCFPAFLFSFLSFFFFFLEKRVFLPHTRLAPKKSLRDLHQKKLSVEKIMRLTPKKKEFRDLRQRKVKRRLMLISTIQLRFPPPWHPANVQTKGCMRHKKLLLLLLLLLLKRCFQTAQGR